MTSEDEVQEEKAREAVLAWITRADSLLDSGALLEIARPRGRIESDVSDALRSRCSRLVKWWDENSPKCAPLLGLTEADWQGVSRAFHVLGTTIWAVSPDVEAATCVDIEEAREVCLAALAKTWKLAAADKNEDGRPLNISPQNRDGRPSAKPISLEFLTERARAGKTLPSIGAEAKTIAEEVKKRIYRERIDLSPPSPRTVEDHIREKYLGQKP